MTEWRMTLTRIDDAGSEVRARRDELTVHEWGLYDDEMVSEALRQHARRVAGSIDAKAATIGLKPTKDETLYGIHANTSGPVQFWVQRYYS